MIGYQLLKSGTSIGANYHEAERAESRADFIHKIALVEKEASETKYWLELLLDGKIVSATEMVDIIDESSQLLAIFTTIGKNAKKKK